MPAPSQTDSIRFSQHVSYICSRFIAYAFPLFFFVVVNSFYLKTYDSAQIKITFTQIGAAVLFVLWITRALVDGRFPFSRKDLVYVAPFLVFFASGIIVWLHTPFKGWSLEETMRRVYYIILALIGIAEMRTKERQTRLWRWLIAAAWVAVGYGLIQYLNSRFFHPQGSEIDPFIWRGAFGPRVFSTFGNPNFYGNFLVIMTPIALASVLRERGPLGRAFIALLLTLLTALCIDKMTLGLFGGLDPSLNMLLGGLSTLFLALLIYFATWKVGTRASLPSFIFLFAILFLNLYSTETKGAWLGFLAAIGATVGLIFEYFLHFEEWEVAPKKYFIFVIGISIAFGIVFSLMVLGFVIPWIKGTIQQTGIQILWIPTAIAAILATLTVLWLVKKPWNLKKVIYGILIFGLITLGGGVLQFAKGRLVSVSFRMFTWISTWEMVRTNPILGNGVGTFKIIYPAFRRPEIIVLEGRSNTETDHAEDEYLEVWQDEGIVGFGIFLWMVVTALTLGFKQLRWYSNHRSLDSPRSKKMLEIDSDPRSYEVLGYMGAYIGALMHWFVDVSIRFVSSGIFSCFLPGMLVAYARNHENPVLYESRLSYDRWIRAGVAAFWTMILLILRVELVPQSLIQGGDTTIGQIYFWNILTGIGLYLLLEILDLGLAPEKQIAVSEQYKPANSRFFVPRLLLIPLLFVLGVIGVKFGCDQFWGDVHHNLAIFFSKEAVWTKSPVYDSKIMGYPPDIREKYQKWGGALEHYKQVVTRNHAFPMAHYFTGNVYNDWGSQVNAESINARNKGQMDEASRLREKAQDMWNKAEESYTATKSLAPNYVQTHHQMGLLYVKRAEQAAQWGDMPKTKEYYQKALDNFRLYNMLDPVFLPNTDRMAQILLMDGKVDEAINFYKKTLYYNDLVCISIHKYNRAQEVTSISLSLAKLYFNQVANQPNAFNPPAPHVLEAIKYFRKATENDPNNLEAWKGLGFMLEKTGQNVDAQKAYHEALRLAPNDPDLKRK